MDDDDFSSSGDELFDELLASADLNAQGSATAPTQSTGNFQRQAQLNHGTRLGIARSSHQNVEFDLQTAQGENAILRAKLEALEKQRNQDVLNLKNQFHNDMNEKLSKLQMYQDLNVKLEDEKKFLRSELTSLTTRNRPNKKRRVNGQDEQDDEVDVMMVDDTPTLGRAAHPNHQHQQRKQQQEHIAQTSSSSLAQQHKPSQSRQNEPIQLASEPQIKIITAAPPQLVNEKQLFIDLIFNHVINGCSETTLSYLERIPSPIDFKHENFRATTEGVNNNVSNAITKYLIQLNNNIRLDNLISEFIEIMTIYVQKLYLDKSLLPIPFVLALIHCALNYRPSALHQDIIEQLLLFNSDFLRNFTSMLKFSTSIGDQTSSQGGPGKTSKGLLQIQMLDQFIVLYAMDILELLSKLSFNRSELASMFTKSLPREILKSGLSNASSINYVFNTVEILTYSMASNDDRGEEGEANLVVEENDDSMDVSDNTSFTKDDDIISLMTKLLVEGCPILQGYRIYSLNRQLGNNDDAIILAKLINPGNPIPSPILSADFKPVSSGNKLAHELHKLNLHFKILKFLEVYFANNSIKALRFDMVSELLGILVWVLLKQQEFLIRNPRSETIYLRTMIMNTIVKLIHFVILRNGEIPQDLILQKLSNTVSYNFIVAFTRISFSSDTNLNLATFKFMRSLQADFEIPIFNKHIEALAYLHNNVTLASTPNDGGEGDGTRRLEAKKEIIANVNNGLEVSFDDEIIEMSRDLIELYTTALEADSLYFAMNKLVENNEIDELMNEYLNE